MPDHLSPGVYDDLVDLFLREQIDQLEARNLRAALTDVDPADIPHRVAQAVHRWVERSLGDIRGDERLEAGVALSQQLLSALRDAVPNAVLTGDELASPLQRLTSIEELLPDGKPRTIEQPLTPLRDTVLMTNARGEPGVGREILAEIASADRIDLICAFIRWTGIRELLPALTRHVETGRQLRVITTTYTGTTEPRALQALQALGGQVKVSYDISTTRLHAKAWLFHRANGHSTVYIGSSNLTFSAQVTGLEWNVRAGQQSNPALVDKFEATFSSYWANPQFEPFETERFGKALRKQTPDDDVALTPFDIQPYPFQRQILEKLRVDRRRGHPHNLVVAATGTGKTVMAGLDYRELKAHLPRARLLYVAHRKEILNQSRATFRHILKDGAFGELWLAGRRPVRWEHVFASIQTLDRNDLSALATDHFDIVIVDEFHHAAASSYREFLDYIRPVHMLGLTATPERADNLDILHWFGGRIAVELRLWDALEQELLSPFHYFGIHDGSDLSTITWRRGKGYGYDRTELTNLYTADHIWVSKVLQAVTGKIGDPKKMRALGFCVSIDHARFMASQLNRANLRAVAIVADTLPEEREDALKRLRSGELQAVFTVDLFNEGIDVPAIDVVLMLRPTESATVFLQQLGRGLRRAEHKDVLTVLDFVGHQRKEFRFDQRYRRMLGRSRTELISDIDQEFPYLPAGCHMELDPVVSEIVLDNIRRALPTAWPRRVQELRELGDVSLVDYLNQTGLDLDDIYRANHYWTEIRRAAAHLPAAGPDGEAKLGRGIGRLQHIDDLERLEFLKGVAASKTPPAVDDLNEHQQRQLQMALLTVFSPRKGDFTSLQEATDALWAHPELLTEFSQVLDLLDDQVVHLHQSLNVPSPVPLQIHAHYSRDEVLAAFGASSVTAPLPLPSGVYWHEPTQTDIFFVTLQKSEGDFSPTTRYKDYAISDNLFHWESQGATAVRSATGQRYLNHRERGTRVALFVRTAKSSGSNRTLPYFCAGLANYVSHESDRPIAITWQLETPLPGDLFIEYRAAVA
jgi:superfamily II DNA or RNA helicase/HKD family nuclease